eukprot:COSAG01_NODE_8029_length_2949_cov_2.693684_2_plen_386_part_01
MCKYNFVSQYSTECDVLESSISTRLSGNCDIDVNECKSSPCKHGGTCSDSTSKSAVSINAYQCTCAPGFANGVCKYNYINEYKAECTVMESDDSTAKVTLSGNCDIDVDECKSSPCKNGALCKDSTVNATLVSAHAYQCVCSVGYANGMCGYSSMAQYSKQCVVAESTSDKSLSGNCDIDVNECVSKPCKNQATCSDSTVRAVATESWQNAIRIVRPSTQFHYASALWATSTAVYNNGNLLSYAYIHQKVSSVRISMNGRSRVFALARKDQNKYSLRDLVTSSTLRVVTVKTSLTGSSQNPWQLQRDNNETRICQPLGFNINTYGPHQSHAKARIGFALSERYPCTHPGSAEGVGLLEETFNENLASGRVQWSGHKDHFYRVSVDV